MAMCQCRFAVTNSDQLIEFIHSLLLVYRYFEFSSIYCFWLKFWASWIAVDVVLTNGCDDVFFLQSYERQTWCRRKINLMWLWYTLKQVMPNFWYLCRISPFTTFWKQWGEPVLTAIGFCWYPRPRTEDERRGWATVSWWEATRVYAQWCHPCSGISWPCGEVWCQSAAAVSEGAWCELLIMTSLSWSTIVLKNGQKCKMPSSKVCSTVWL